MSLSDNSNSCVNSKSVWFLFASLWVVFSYFFACLVIFYWIPVIVNFTLFAVGYFYISINIFELYSWIQLKYKETVWSFCSCLKDSLGWTRAVLHLGLIISHHWNKTFLSIVPTATWTPVSCVSTRDYSF